MVSTDKETHFVLKGVNLPKDLAKTIEDLINRVSLAEIAKMDYEGDISELTKRNMKLSDLPQNLFGPLGLKPEYYGMVTPPVLDWVKDKSSPW